jgi:prephenate dehydratase
MKIVAYLGPAGTFGAEAAEKKFKALEGYKLEACKSHENAFDRVYNGTADYCVLAVENSIDGIVSETYHALVD